MNLYQRIEIIFKNDKTNPFINMVNRKIDIQKVKIENYTYRTIILFFLYLQRKTDKITNLNNEIQSLNSKIRNILSKEKVKTYNDDSMLNYKIQSETPKRDRKISLNENLVAACLNDKYLGEKFRYLPILKAYIPLNSEEKNIIKIFAEEITPEDIKELRDHPLVLLKKLHIMLKKENFLEAYNIIVSKRHIFFQVYSELFLKELILLQMLTMRIGFMKKEFLLLSNLLFVDFSRFIEDENYRAKFLNLAGSNAIVCGFFDEGIAMLKTSYRLNAKPKRKAKAAFLIGATYDYLKGVYPDKNYKNLSIEWFSKSIEQINCFWSFLSFSFLKKIPRVVNFDDLSVSSFSDSHHHLFSAKKNLEKGNILRAIQFIYSLKKADWTYFSPTMKVVAKYFIDHTDKACLFRFASFYFKINGTIVREFYPIPDYFQRALNSKILTLDECCQLLGIASEESKFLDHNYFNLDKKFGLGVFQVNPTEIRKICKTLKIPYDKQSFLNNKIFQIRIAVEILRYHFSFVKKDLFFAFYYYCCGHESYSFKNSHDFLRVDHPLFACIFLSNMKSHRIRGYLIGVMEYYIIQHLIHLHCLPKFFSF